MDPLAALFELKTPSRKQHPILEDDIAKAQRTMTWKKQQ
jgi:hypothetical protein